jgi:transposase
MEMLGKIRRMYLRDKLSLHEIVKRTGLSRNTIRRWLKAPGEAALPTYRRTEAPVKLTPFHATLEQALKADSHRNKQNRRTAKALFEQIKADGYAGCYSRVTDFIRDWRGREGKAPHAFVPLKFELGEAFQFDWSEEGLVVPSKNTAACSTSSFFHCRTWVGCTLCSWAISLIVLTPRTASKATLAFCCPLKLFRLSSLISCLLCL